MAFTRTASATARAPLPVSYKLTFNRVFGNAGDPIFSRERFGDKINMRVPPALQACAAALTLSLMAFGATTPGPVADAAMKGDLTGVRTLLTQKADVNAPQPDGATAIQWAAYTNNLALADVLIKGGANVKLANHDGATPLSLAAINSSAPMIEKLLQAGADPNERQPNG